MTSRDLEIERRLIADADDADSWDEPIAVPASRAPRPVWYGRTKHLELAAKFHLLSILHRLGVEATLTHAEPDGVDIAAVRGSGEVSTIDVKTLEGSDLWSIEGVRARKNHFIAFVVFSGELSDPHTIPDVYLWQSTALHSLLARQEVSTVSVQILASKLDAASAWQDFVTHPAA